MKKEIDATIKSMWQDYMETVMPKDAPQIQKNECRLAFYAGFYSMMTINYKLGGSDVPESVGVLYLETLRKEMNEFMHSLGGTKTHLI